MSEDNSPSDAGEEVTAADTEQLDPHKAQPKDDASSDTADLNKDGSDEEDSEADREERNRARRERERRARDRSIAKQAELETENRLLKEQLSAGRSEAQPGNGQPQEKDFDDYFAFQRALARYEMKQELMPEIEKAKASQAKSREEDLRDKVVDAANKRAEAYAKTKPDFAEVVEDLRTYERTNSFAAVRDAILESELGPQIAYNLGKNPDLADRLFQMGPLSAVREIGKLEAKLTPSKARTETRAPDPATRLKGGVTANKSHSDMSMDEYAEAWKARQKKR